MSVYIRLGLLAAAALILFVYVYFSGHTTLEKAYKEVQDELKRALDRLRDLLKKVPESDLVSEKSLEELLPAFDECNVLFGAYLHGVYLRYYPDLPLEDEDDIERVKQAVLNELTAHRVITRDEYAILATQFESAPMLLPERSVEIQQHEPEMYRRMVAEIPQYYESMRAVMGKIDNIPLVE